MGVTTIGALIGAGIDSLSGDDGNADGAMIGAVGANVLKVVLPVVVTYAVGWGVLRALGHARELLATGAEAAGVIGKVIGAEMQRQRGESGLKGAAVGVVATAALRRMGPLGLLIGGAYVAKKALDRRRDGPPPAA